MLGTQERAPQSGAQISRLFRLAVYPDYEQVAVTLPFFVGLGLSVQVRVNTTVPTGCSILIVKGERNAMSVMSSVHWGFGHCGAPGIGVVGAPVVTV
jgi:hypothetical protein